jgi:hypothetical protein
MAGYRAYLIGVDVHIAGCTEIVATNDEYAIRKANQMLKHQTIEVWLNATRIGTLELPKRQLFKSMRDRIRFKFTH